MKKGKRALVCAWILVFCFAAGQWAVYAHRHSGFGNTTRTTRGTVVVEKCRLCDAMHHTSMIQHTLPVFTCPAIVADHIYKQDKYNFISISLILSSGRAPPLS